MLEEDNRISNLGNTIIADARADAEKIIQDAQEQAEKIIGEAKEQYRLNEQAQLAADKQKTMSDYSKEISSRDFAAQRDVLAYRTALVDKLFDGVAERIEGYKAGDDYIVLLNRLIEKANSSEKIREGCIIYLSAADMKLSDKLDKKYPAEIKTDKSIMLGGVSVFYPDKNIFIDYTLDTAFEKQRRAFVNNKELSL